MGIAQRSRAYFIPPIGKIVYSKVAPPIGGVFFARHQGSASSKARARKAARQARSQARLQDKQGRKLNT